VEEQKNEVLSAREMDILWEQIENTNKKYDRSRRMKMTLISSGVAASVVLAVVTGIWTMERAGERETDYMAIMEFGADEGIRATDIILTTDKGEDMSIEGKFVEIEYGADGSVAVNGEKLPVGVDGKGSAMNRLATPYGKRSLLRLADGTKRWLNSNTKVIFPGRFAKDRREVFVAGEVFLDVSCNEKAPFVVKTDGMEVKVLGTSFNVLSGNEYMISEVVLVEGKVEGETGDDNQNTLYPSQLFSYDAATDRSSITVVNTADYVAWKDGYYKFNHQTLDIVLERINRFYGTNVKWDGRVAELMCSGKLDFMNDLEGTLAALCKAAPVRIEKRGEEIFVCAEPRKGI